MCGIVGVFNYNQHAEGQQPFIQWALSSMHHRGPDSNGTWLHQNYIAGFVRLAIRDLSDHGNQPMVSECGNYAISFNGEIYNTTAFKEKLSQLGVSFRSTTDTEVLLYALIHWGEAYVLEHFDGIFAFAFYNARKNELLLTRDRLGIKPLYIGYSKAGIVYSSQYDHVIRHPYIIDNTINEAAIGSYLQLGYVPENEGAINGTFLLPHGYYVKVEASGYTLHNYYQYSLAKASAFEDNLSSLLERTIASQMVSDVPVGTFMSGGVDSPLVSYFANKQSNLSSFTIGVDDPAIDESAAAANYAGIFGTDHHNLFITEKDLLDTVEDNTRAYSEPFSDFSSIPTLLLSKYTKSKVTVAFSGDGGDELFWGYPRNLRMLQEGLLFRKSKLERVVAFGKEKLTGGKRTIRRRHLQVNDFPAYYYRSLFITGAEQWLPSMYIHQPGSSFFLDKIYQHDLSKLDDQQVMNVVRKMEVDLHLQRILLKVDRASMYHSLEVRVPLLGNEVIRYSEALQYNDCVKNGHGKYNLKNLLIEKTNEQLVMQPKKGFVIPIGKWLRNELSKDVTGKLMDMPAELAGLFNRNQLQKILQEHQAGTQDWGWLLWSLYSLVNWHSFHRTKHGQF